MKHFAYLGLFAAQIFYRASDLVRPQCTCRMCLADSINVQCPTRERFVCPILNPEHLDMGFMMKGQGTVKHLWYENCYYPGDVKIVVVAALNNLTIFQPGTKLFFKPKVLK